MTPTLATSRLRIIGADLAMARAAAAGNETLARALGAAIDPAWPPEILRDAFSYMVSMYESDPGLGGWGMWFIMLRAEPDLLIGSGGFKGAPGAVGGPGTVEIGYSVVPTHEGRGYATEAAAALTAWAFESPAVERVIAHTFERHDASVRVLRKCGYSLRGPGFEQVDENERMGRGELVLFEIPRDQWRRREPRHRARSRSRSPTLADRPQPYSGTMFELSIETAFAAAHALMIQGAREPIHGHNWHVTVVAEGDTLDGDGLLMDFHVLEGMLGEIVSPMRNNDLGRVPPFDSVNPSAELVARHIGDEMSRRLAGWLGRQSREGASPPPVRIASVRITEAPGCAAVYRPRATPVAGTNHG
ncbi:MAG: GNAT family N-acetyltransferase [Phycisphaeraceae bacterium]|nr:GNAT family N-acetyltransferase [Phycisphaeraceae bacterium]